MKMRDDLAGQLIGSLVTSGNRLQQDCNLQAGCHPEMASFNTIPAAGETWAVKFDEAIVCPTHMSGREKAFSSWPTVNNIHTMNRLIRNGG
jgi:hypothetical protein